MVPNPCCCWTLPNGAKGTAVFELVVGLGEAILFYMGLSYLTGLEESDPKKYDELKVNLPFTITSLILGIIRAVAGGVLGLGTWGENIKLCWIWIGLATLGSVIYLILMTVLLTGGASVKLNAVMIGYGLVYLFRIYLIYVVFAFIVQLKQEIRLADQEAEAVGTALSQASLAVNTSTSNAAKEPVEQPQ